MSIPSAVSIYPAMFTAALENVSGLNLEFYQVALVHLAMVIFILIVSIYSILLYFFTFFTVTVRHNNNDCKKI